MQELIAVSNNRLQPVTRDQGQKLTYILAALTLGRPIQEARIVESCGRVLWCECLPHRSFDPGIPLIVGAGHVWCKLVREWAEHLEAWQQNRYWHVENWSSDGQKIIIRICDYARSYLKLTAPEFQFLAIRLWYSWATAGEIDDAPPTQGD